MKLFKFRFNSIIICYENRLRFKKYFVVLDITYSDNLII